MVECVVRVQSRRSYPKRLIVQATLDVQNPFNSILWSNIMKALQFKFRAPERYRVHI